MTEKQEAIVTAARARYARLPPKVQIILDAVAERFGITTDELLSPDKHKNVAAARHVAQWAIRQSEGYSYPELGAMFDRDHTSVMSAVRRIDREVERRTRVGERAIEFRSQARLRSIPGVGTVLELEEAV